MPNTAITLDVTRSEMTEARFSVSRHARDITSPTAKNSLYQWPMTGTYTLQPINLTTDFIETSHWEPLKYRLKDCTYNPDWWTEQPENNVRGVGPADYFLHGVVKDVNWSPSNSGGAPGAVSHLLDLLVDIAGIATVTKINLESQYGVAALQSKEEQKANQGYCLRFRIDGRQESRRAGILDFLFGQFFLRLNSAGEAQLWQSADLVNYSYVFAFPWASINEVHGRVHTVVIYPHCRNKIEFLASTADVVRLGDPVHPFVIHGTVGRAIYEIPGQVILQADGITPLITQKSKWTLRVTKEYRPKIQISKLAFANGTNPQAFFWDSVQDITSRTGVVYAPTVPLYPSAEVDLNGGHAQWKLINPDVNPPVPFVSDGNSKRFQFAFGMQGVGDIPGPGLGSTITPEFYGYTIDKPPAFFRLQRQSYTCPVSNIKIDHGDAPEAERLSVSTYDNGAYARFSERGDIPLELGDADSHLLFFEGTAHQVEASECPAQTPNAIHLEAHGMIDNMLRMDWGPASPDFAKDPYDEPDHKPYLFAEMIRVCFEASGEPRENVVIEEEELYLKNFRLWSRGTAKQNAASGGDGQPVSEDKEIGSGHKAGVAKGSIWHPSPGSAVHEFTDHIIRHVLGWNWVRSRADKKWHIYKRPDPNLPADVAAKKFVPKVEFYSDGHPRGGYMGQPLPAYKHSDLKKRLKRPKCTTIICASAIDTAEITDSGDLADTLTRGSSTAWLNGTSDPSFEAGAKMNYQTCSNYFGYVNTLNPNPNLNNPDFIGSQRIRTYFTKEVESKAALAWICRRYFEDNCFGYLYRSFEADWGDVYTYNLRKWDMVLVNGMLHYIDRIEPDWSDKKVRRAKYTVTKYRAEVRPPR